MFTTICFDNELYANTGGQESGLMQKGFVAKMAPKGKAFDKVRLVEIAKEAGCAYSVMLTVSKPNRVEEVINNAVHIAREVGPTFVQLYTPCILEIGKQSMEGLDEMKDSEQIGGRFVQRQHITDAAQVVIDRLKEEKKARKKAARDYAKSINFKNEKKVVS